MATVGRNMSELYDSCNIHTFSYALGFILLLNIVGAKECVYFDENKEGDKILGLNETEESNHTIPSPGRHRPLGRQWSGNTTLAKHSSQRTFQQRLIHQAGSGGVASHLHAEVHSSNPPNTACL